MNNEWLSSLKPGDRVIIEGGYDGTLEVRKVARITKTAIFVKITDTFEKRFRIDDGMSTGSDHWHRSMLHEPTPELLDKIEVSKLKNKLKDIRGKLPIPQDKETLLKMIEALKPFV